jgi:hypothetical protein
MEGKNRFSSGEIKNPPLAAATRLDLFRLKKVFVGRETNRCPACRTYRHVIAQDFFFKFCCYLCQNTVTWRLTENIGHVVDLFDSGVTNNVTIVEIDQQTH